MSTTEFSPETEDVFRDHPEIIRVMPDEEMNQEFMIDTFMPQLTPVILRELRSSAVRVYYGRKN